VNSPESIQIARGWMITAKMENGSRKKRRAKKDPQRRF